MTVALPVVYLARHGETEWTVSGQHTGRTDIPLTAHGELEAQHLAGRLGQIAWTRVFTSPLRRAVRTCELAGLAAAAEVSADLVEWDYGAYEGLTSAEIRARQPGWQLFRDGCPSSSGCGPSPETWRSSRAATS
jgi:broad specificity phosphatase PhoE